MGLLLATLAVLAQDEPKGERHDLKLGRLFVPAHFKAVGKVDLLVHFHGSAKVVEREFAVAKKNAVLVSVHVGSGSSVYARAMKEPDALQGVIDEALSRIPEAKPGRLFLSSFSAGYGAIREILRHGRHEVEGMLLPDSLHAGYEEGKPKADQMEPFAKYARSGKPLWITHSAIVPGDYAGTTETADALIAALGARREAAEGTNDRGMKLVSKADKGGFHVRGYEGTTAAAHLDHLHNLGEHFSKLLFIFARNYD